jgi:hydroxypyruvate reductase
MLLDRLARQPEGRPVLFLLSGGASSLMELPHEGITLQDLQQTTEYLLRSGAPIQAINTVRKHLSAVKGGQLLRHARGPVWTLVISDVVGNDPDVIGSGPTIPDPTTFADALEVLRQFHLLDRVPSPVRHLLERGTRGEIPETLKDLHDHPYPTVYHILADPFTAAHALRVEARRLGYRTVILNAMASGETHETARFLVDALRSCARYHHPVAPPACVILAGETTLEVHGTGKGGRNQEFALYAGLLLERYGLDALVLALGTDGTDGPTDAAGAWVSPAVLARARERGLSPETALNRQDSYTFFKKAGTQILTGPTCTNVCDLMVGIGPDPTGSSTPEM